MPDCATLARSFPLWPHSSPVKEGRVCVSVHACVPVCAHVWPPRALLSSRLPRAGSLCIWDKGVMLMVFLRADVSRWPCHTLLPSYLRNRHQKGLRSHEHSDQTPHFHLELFISLLAAWATEMSIQPCSIEVHQTPTPSSRRLPDCRVLLPFLKSPIIIPERQVWTLPRPWSWSHH